MKNVITFFLISILFGLSAKSQVWEPVGNPAGISAGGVGRLSIVNDYQDNLVIGYFDGVSGKGAVQKYDGSNWAYLGSDTGMTSGYALFNSLSVSSQGVVYFTNQAGYPDNGLEVRKFDNGNWVDLPDATSTTINYQASAISADDILFVVSGENSGTIKKFVNGTWQQVGNSGFFGGTPFYLDMAIGSNGMIYVSFNNNGYVHVYQNNVNASSTDNWEPVGGNANLAPAANSENYNSSLAIDGNNNLFVAYVSPSENKLNVKKYDGTSWSQLGSENFTENRVQHTSIAVGANNIVYVAVSNWENDNFLKNYVMAYDEANNTWSQAGTGWASEGQATNNSLAVDSEGNLFLAFSDDGLGKLSVKKLNLSIVAAQSVEIATQGGVPPEITVDDGTLQLVATVYPEQASQDVIWSIDSGETFATVDSTGLVTAIASNALVTVKATTVENTSIFDTFEVTITNQNSSIEPDSISVSTVNSVYPDIFSLGGTVQLKATTTPPEADQYVTWTVEEGADVVSIDTNGLVTSISEGYAIVRATNKDNTNLYDEIRVNVWENGCTQGNETMIYGLGYGINNQYSASDDFVVDNGVRFAVSTIRMNIISSANIDITSFDLHFLKNDVDRPGEEIITVSNIVPTYQTFVHDWGYGLYQYKVELDLPEPVIFDQGTYWLKPVATAEDGSDVYWDVTVYGTLGYSMYVDYGDGHEWRGLGGFNAIFDITGNCTPIPVVVNTTNGEDTEIFVGETLQLEATVNEPGVSQNVTWSVEEGAEYASVNGNGLVTGLGVGVATIRATSVDNENVYGEIEVTVLNPNSCDQEVLSNNLENAYALGGGVRLAVDITVDDNKTFTITSVEPSVVNFATNFSFVFYKDADGFPGSEIVASANGTITHNITTGYAFDYYFHRYAVELDNPVILSTGTYWMEMLSDAIGWEATSADVIGHPGAFNSDLTGGKWEYSSTGMEFVYKLNGTCNDTVSSIAESNLQDINIFNANNELNVDLGNSGLTRATISVYNINGQKMFTAKQSDVLSKYNLSGFRPGIYIAHLFTGDVAISKKFFIK